MRAKSLLCSLLMLGLVGFSSQAKADDVPVVLYAPANDGLPDALAAAKMAKAVLGASTFKIEGELGQALGLHEKPVWSLETELTGCAGELVPASLLIERLAQASDAVNLLEHEEARRLLRGASEMLPCLAEAVATDDLYRISFLEGVNAFNEGDAAAAEEAFRRAAVIDKTREWDSTFAPEPREAFLAGLQRAIATPGAEVRAQGFAQGALLLDGRSWEETDARDLLAGEHLVQVRFDETARGFVMKLPERTTTQSVRLLTGEEMLAGILTDDEAVLRWFASQAGERGWQRVLIMSGEGALPISTTDSRFGPSIAMDKLQDRIRLIDDPEYLARIERQRRQTVGVGTGVLIGGGVLMAVGMPLYDLEYKRGRDLLESMEPVPLATYETAYRNHRVGIGLAIAGGTTFASGLVITIAGSTQKSKLNPDLPMALPWAAADSESVVIGVAAKF